MNMNLKQKLKNEPVVLGAAIPALAGAVLVLLVSFGIPITPDQADAIVNVLTLAIPLAMMVGAWIARSKVSPVDRGDGSDADE